MKNIKGVELVLRVLKRFSMCEFPIVRELRFYESLDGAKMTQKLFLIVESEGLGMNYRLSIEFDGVVGLKLSDFGGGTKRIDGLHIDDVSADQLEGIRWEVYSVEDVSFGFCAKTVEVYSIEEVGSQLNEFDGV